MKLILKFFSLPLSEKKLICEALFWIYLSKFCLLLFSFKYCVKLTAQKKTLDSTETSIGLNQIKVALNRANKMAYWKNVCLVQSIAARWMLNRRKIYSEVKIGVIHNTKKEVIAHAWVVVGNLEVVKKGADYYELISL